MQRLSLPEAAAKIKTYCAYQERCHDEVRQKLYGFGLYSKEVDQLIADLIQENYLNEERFARLFAGGKFRMKDWGRIKITQELRLRKVSDYNIRAAMKEISPDAYQATLDKLAGKKWENLKGKKIEKAARTTRFLMQKGYELTLIQATIARLQEEI
ncbi:regulatory protein RecX [Arachidicoccus terrestris]|uniref:regulatory protein RecX n=1 Tax=Arachidicoccus terrestris TaxID=2875539 RepID=UPI001CC6341E|nr:regulatory protein RecX [Arachidicoccus terrestris]UAY57111.1 RecX family transcriptional regulator [Arachidicoccus terrestris]